MRVGDSSRRCEEIVKNLDSAFECDYYYYYTHTHTHTQAHMRTHTHAHTQRHTHTCTLTPRGLKEKSGMMVWLDREKEVGGGGGGGGGGGIQVPPLSRRTPYYQMTGAVDTREENIYARVAVTVMSRNNTVQLHTFYATQLALQVQGP